MKNLLLPLVLILLAAAGTVFFATQNSGDETTAAAAGALQEADYDYYVRDMRTTRFGTSGQPVSQLQAAAAAVTHYPEGDRAELERPAFRSFGIDSDAWQVSAAAGTLVPDTQRGEDRLDLQGDVALRKPQAAGNFIDVNTTALTVFVSTEEAITEAPVTLRTRNSRADGTGMRALLAEDSIIQLHDGKGTHDPATRP